MEEWRFKALSVTKYDPAKRNALGHYTDFEEWTSCCDIGKQKDGGKMLTVAEYLRVEQQYIDAVLLLFELTGSSGYTITELYKTGGRKYFFEKNSLQRNDASLFSLHQQLKNYKKESLTMLPDVVRLALREHAQLTLKFKDKYQSRIYFGYDYYMYYVTDFDLKAHKTAFDKTGIYLD